LTKFEVNSIIRFNFVLLINKQTGLLQVLLCYASLMCMPWRQPVEWGLVSRRPVERRLRQSAMDL